MGIAEKWTLTPLIPLLNLNMCLLTCQNSHYREKIYTPAKPVTLHPLTFAKALKALISAPTKKKRRKVKIEKAR